MKTTTLWTALLFSAGLSVLPACKDKGMDKPAGDMSGEMAKPAGEMAKPTGEMAKPEGEMARPEGEMGGDMAKPEGDMAKPEGEMGAASDDKKMEPGK